MHTPIARKGNVFRARKPVENLYIGVGWAFGCLWLLVGIALLITLPLQARTFVADQAMVALPALAVGGFLLHAFVRKMQLAGARASIERDPLTFIEAHSYGKSLRADGEFESLTARMSVLCRLHSIVSRGFAEVLSSYLKLYREYEPNSVQWRASVRSLDEKVQTRFAGKLAGHERSVGQFANGGPEEGLATGDESRAARMQESRADE